MKRVSPHDKKGFTSRAQAAQGRCRAKRRQLPAPSDQAIEGKKRAGRLLAVERRGNAPATIKKKQAPEVVGVCLWHKKLRVRTAVLHLFRNKIMDVFRGLRGLDFPFSRRAVGLEATVSLLKPAVAPTALHNLLYVVEGEQTFVIITQKYVARIGAFDQVGKSLAHVAARAIGRAPIRIVAHTGLAVQHRTVVAGDGFQDMIIGSVLPAVVRRVKVEYVRLQAANQLVGVILKHTLRTLTQDALDRRHRKRTQGRRFQFFEKSSIDGSRVGHTVHILQKGRQEEIKLPFGDHSRAQPRIDLPADGIAASAVGIAEVDSLRGVISSPTRTKMTRDKALRRRKIFEKTTDDRPSFREGGRRKCRYVGHQAGESRQRTVADIMLIEYEAVKLPIVGRHAATLQLIKAADGAGSGKEVAKGATSCYLTGDGGDALVDKG